MKQILLKTWLVMLCLLVGVGTSWAEEQTATLTFSAACKGSGIDDKGNSWTVASDAEESSFENARGIHYGTSSAKVSYLKLTNSSFTGTITKIVVNAAGASGTIATLNVNVGGNAFGSQKSLTSSNAAYTFNGSASGNIEILLAQTATTRALYVKSVAVTYSTAADTRTAVNITSFSAEETTLVKNSATNTTITNDQYGWSPSYTYESSNTSVATISNTGEITAVAKGTARITASLNIANDDENWKKGETSSKTIDITVNNPSHIAHFSINGNIDSENDASVEEGESITFPTDPADITDKKFLGWTKNQNYSNSTTAPSDMAKSATMGDGDVTYYAVFAVLNSSSAVETKIQTLQYDTWTYSGTTTNRATYRLFHTGSYIESASFDRSKLSKVIVYGGTFGGAEYNSLTIGDGTNTWKSVTVSGTNQTGINTYTDGTALSGTGTIRITSNSGNNSGSGCGVRISKVEIYTMEGGYTYSDYCTTVSVKTTAPLTTMDDIYAKAQEVNGTETEVRVKFNDWVVSGVNGSNTYVTDGTKGFIIYKSGHNFVAGDILNGTISAKIKLFNGAAEFTTITSTTEGLTVTKGGSVSEQRIAINDLTGINTGSLVAYEDLTYHLNGTSAEFTDGENVIVAYKGIISELPKLVEGKKYDVKGIFLMYGEKKEILPRSAEDIVLKETINNYSVNIETPENGTIVVKDGETVIDNGDEVAEGTILTIECTPTDAENYRFKNWQYKAEGMDAFATRTKDFTYTMPSANVQFKANFEEIPIYTIAFCVNGVERHSEKLKEGTNVTPVDTPENINGKVFTGWIETASVEGETPAYVSPSATAKKNVTYYAVFANAEGTGEPEDKTITLNFVGDDWGIPVGSDNKIVNETSYSYGGYTIKLAGNTGNGFYMSTSNNKPVVLMLGKSGAYLKLPVLSTPIKKVTCLKTPNTSVSTSVKWNIYAGENQASTEVTGCENGAEFIIGEAYQNSELMIKVTNSYNTQFTGVEILTVAPGYSYSGYTTMPAVLINAQVTSGNEKAFNTTGETAVILNRKFNDGAYNTLVLPFGMSESQIEEVFGSDAKVYNYAGTKTAGENTVTLQFEAATTIFANKPVFIYGAKNAENKIIEGVTIEDADLPTITDENGAFDYVGVYAISTVAAGDIYINSKNELKTSANGTTKLQPTRAYFKKVGAANVDARAFSINDETTGIAVVEDGNVKLYNGDAYTLSGQKVSAKNIKSGIYIIGGRKVVVK